MRNGSPAALSDEELLDRFASRRSEQHETAELAFAALLARHGLMVLRVCRAVLGDRNEVEDAFQATFLVLAVRARSIRRRDSVASWLHGVALRVAASERSRAARRRRHELAWAAMNSSVVQKSGSDAVCDAEVTLLIHEEIGRLPEKYRAAVVLCYLEGLTHEMAAERLGWPVGSVKSRLAWARQRLRVRLTRRGVGPAALPFDQAGSSRDAESIPVPLATRLADATLCSAVLAGVNKRSLAGIVSAEAVALMEGTIQSMTNAKLMLMAAAALIVGVFTAGACVTAYSAVRRENSARNRDTGQEARQKVVPSPIAQGRPRPAAAKGAMDQGPVNIQIEVADPAGHRLSGADVAITVNYARAAGSLETVFERVETDGAGKALLEVARQRPGARVHSANVWVYQAGRAIATKNVSFARTANRYVVSVTLDDLSKFTITVLGQDDRPIAGIHLTPHLLRRTGPGNSLAATIPESWHERLAVTTDARGVATLTCLPGNMKPLSIRVAGQGVAPHTLRVEPPAGSDAVLRLGRPGRVVGVVRTASGAPLADVPVELWVQGAKIVRSDFAPADPFGNRRITPDEILRFDPEPLKTGPQGAFQTPPNLLSGSTYRVIVRREGFQPFVSDWVTLSGDRTVIPPIRLQPLETLTGVIKDRQGRAIVGARVFLAGGGPRTVTDPQGRFALAGIDPGKTVMLVEQPGFRLQGWLFDPPSQPVVGSFTLVRLSDAPESVMKPLADPIPHEESRALANRLLEPYLKDPFGDDVESVGSRLRAVAALGDFDLIRAVELLQNGEFRDEDRNFQFIRGALAAKLAVTEPARAEAMAESNADLGTKINAVASVAKALPASERIRKHSLLERATGMLKNDAQQANELSHLQGVSALADGWLDLGERDRARLVLEEVKISAVVFQTDFLSQLARLEPDEIVARLRNVPTTRVNAGYRDRALTQVAVQLATDHPALAEQVFNLREGGNNQSIGSLEVMRLCRRLAGVDPTRARRVVDSISDPATRACGFAYVALGLAEKAQAGAMDAIDRAIREIDRLRESAPAPEPSTGVFNLYATNPAAVILPVVERVAPERLAEVYWRAVALHPQIDSEQEDLLKRSNAGIECTLLARYDRRVAAALFEPMESYIRTLATAAGPREQIDFRVIIAKGCIDPRSAVALLESISNPPDSRGRGPTEQARIRLGQVLGMPQEKRWAWLWRSMGIPLDD